MRHPTTSPIRIYLAILFATVLVVSGCQSVTANDLEWDDSGYTVSTVADGFEYPWGLDFLPQSEGNYALVTERTGAFYLLDLDTGGRTRIQGEVPEVTTRGQGGLLDVAVHPEFSHGENWVYVTYAAANETGNEFAAHLGRGRFNTETAVLEDFEVLLVAEPFFDGTGHYGSRVVFDHDGYLFMSTGDRRIRDSSQNLQNYWGTTIRLNPDGSIPEDNPFVDNDDVLDGIYTYGHRNVQGMTVHPETGDVWQNEHGQQDGDEINIIDVAGGNYGWPVATYSREYGSGAEIGDLPHERDDIVNPVYYWDGERYDDGQDGFPPSGMTFARGKLYMGNLPFEYLAEFELEGSSRENVEVVSERRILGNVGRIRDVARNPETGDLYVIADESSAPVLRLQFD